MLELLRVAVLELELSGALEGALLDVFVEECVDEGVDDVDEGAGITITELALLDITTTGALLRLVATLVLLLEDKLDRALLESSALLLEEIIVELSLNDWLLTARLDTVGVDDVIVPDELDGDVLPPPPPPQAVSTAAKPHRASARNDTPRLSISCSSFL